MVFVKVFVISQDLLGIDDGLVSQPPVNPSLVLCRSGYAIGVSYLRNIVLVKREVHQKFKIIQETNFSI
ncbi:hypothetical protein SDC9_103032 [bioreactor metagenome]|uniref:Uncharacterized protein n=1 Tax=bioreactor metagenome TaxID=1076179 RepID=A0A645ASZ1_9ZZZZ